MTTITSSGIDPANFDTTCKPCQDFYQFANGGWMVRNPLPATYPTYGAFTALSLRNRDVLREILEEAAASNAPAGSNEQKIGDCYAAGMDEIAIEKAGIAPLNAQLALIDTLTDTAALPSVLAQLNERGSGGFFDFGSEIDMKNSMMTIAGIRQGGLGLPSRDYYFDPSAAGVSIRETYVAHVSKMLTFIGTSGSQADVQATTVLAIETGLAQASLSPADMRDPEKRYHKMDFAELSVLAPAFRWDTYFSTLGIMPNAINVNNPIFVSAFSKNLGRWSPSEIRTYLRWHLVRAFARALPAAIEEAHFDFYSRTLQGTKEQLPRWQRCVEVIDTILGEALGEAYVAKASSPKAEADVLMLLQNVKATLRDEISTLDWMSETTHAKAIAKLDAVNVKIGYPDTWRDYSTLTISRDSYLANLIEAARFNTRFDLAKIDKPTDRNEWAMTPPTVNAYYQPRMNEIVFPAGILHPPFFHADADPAINYGAIGMIIAHELIHAFDDSGRKFDLDGNLSDWWEPGDALNFEERKQSVIDQFDALEPLPGVHENGRLIIGEAIADLGGVRIAYKAFERWQATQPRNVIDNFTPEQRFFLGFASIWVNVESEEYIRYYTAVNTHPYQKFRVNATLANMPEFAQAWQCSIGLMVRPAAKRCRIW